MKTSKMKRNLDKEAEKRGLLQLPMVELHSVVRTYHQSSFGGIANFEPDCGRIMKLYIATMDPGVFVDIPVEWALPGGWIWGNFTFALKGTMRLLSERLQLYVEIKWAIGGSDPHAPLCTIMIFCADPGLVKGVAEAALYSNLFSLADINWPSEEMKITEIQKWEAIVQEPLLNMEHVRVPNGLIKNIKKDAQALQLLKIKPINCQVESKISHYMNINDISYLVPAYLDALLVIMNHHDSDTNLAFQMGKYFLIKSFSLLSERNGIYIEASVQRIVKNFPPVTRSVIKFYASSSEVVNEIIKAITLEPSRELSDLLKLVLTIG